MLIGSNALIEKLIPGGISDDADLGGFDRLESTVDGELIDMRSRVEVESLKFESLKFEI